MQFRPDVITTLHDKPDLAHYKHAAPNPNIFGQTHIAVFGAGAYRFSFLRDTIGSLDVAFSWCGPEIYLLRVPACLIETKGVELPAVFDPRKQKWVALSHRSVTSAREWEDEQGNLLAAPERERVDAAFANMDAAVDRFNKHPRKN